MDTVLGIVISVSSLVILGIYLVFKKRPNYTAWETVASSVDGLRFDPGSPPYREPNVMGHYRGCRVELHSTANRTFLDVAALQPIEVALLWPDSPVEGNEVAAELLY